MTATPAPAVPQIKLEPAAPPAAPAAPAKPVTPPIPKAQASSAPKPAAPPPLATTTPAGTPRPPETLSQSLSKVAKEVFEGKTAAPAGEPPADPPAPPAAPPAAGDPAKTEPTAPTPGADPFAHIKQPEGMSDTSLVGWKALKTEAANKIAAAEKKLTDAQAELDVLKKATPGDIADIARLKTDLQAAHDRLAVLDVQSHPDFQRQYSAPKKKALEEAQSLLTDNTVEGAPDVTGLLAKPRAEFSKVISELAAKMPVYDQAAFTNSMREAYRLHGEEKGALSKSTELAQQLQAKTAQQQRAAFDATWKEFDGKVKPLAMPENATAEQRAEVQAYNDALAGIKTAAEKNAFGKLDERGVADLAAKAAALDFVATRAMPRLEREFANARQLIKELTDEITALKGKKNPGTFSAPAGAPADVDTSKMTIAELSKHMFKG